LRAEPLRGADESKELGHDEEYKEEFNDKEACLLKTL
jgi:hypothetical protein